MAQVNNAAIIDPLGNAGNHIKEIVLREIYYTMENFNNITIIERHSVNYMLMEKNIRLDLMTDETQVCDVGKELKVNYVFVFTVSEQGKNYIISCKVVDVLAGGTVRLNFTQTRNGLADLVICTQQIVRDLMDSMEIIFLQNTNKIINAESFVQETIEMPPLIEKQEKELAEQKAREEKELAEQKVREEKELAERKVREEKELAEQKVREEKELAERKVREEKELAEQKAREEKELAEQKVREEKELAERKVREEKELAEQKAREEKLKAEEEKRLRQERAKVFLENFPNTIEFSASGGKETVNINEYENLWDVLEIPSWCSTQKTEKSLILTCNSNPSPNLREGNFLIYAEEQSKKISISQKALTALEKGDWKQSLNKVMHNGGTSYRDGLYKGEKSGRGSRNGLGVYFFVTENESYWGDFLQGESNGKGVYIIGKEGDSYFSGCWGCKYYVGNWSSDMKNGLGKCYDKTGDLLYFGYFHNEKPAETFPQKYTDPYKFECIEYGNGDLYLGETFEGVEHGFGIFFSTNGNAWYGEWKAGVQNGNGIEFQYSGSFKTGRWSGNTIEE